MALSRSCPVWVKKLAISLAALMALITPALGGPPYLTNDPVPTEFRGYEIYFFSAGKLVPGGAESETGIDFNYGAAPNLQLTAEMPFKRDVAGRTGLANVALAVKYRFLTQDSFGLDVSFFPKLILPSASSAVGDRHMSLMLPFWAQRDFGKWSVFGGGGCTLNHTRSSNDFCRAGLAVTREIADGLKLGAEVFHSGSPEPGGHANTALGVGLTWSMSERYHLLASWGPNLTRPTTNGRSNFYAALLFTP